ncbi:MULTISPECIES: S8 family serine peptidase [unclassified Arsukibacterium]|uniref:S8 family serine peptidase n=1 Tax=unclassified Arsukibacterium TaxID=2635278 RepID=UPI000C69CED1|nr:MULTISPECIES: S8 family serine peptidase [unclassified Arsukibacterium]MAA95925.1 peptidase S8 [Rheinheimera sp.]MBM34771.1 peptidase S8 [Rheinheimera sp.]HAW91645.1 peptidase S8 [Candidatus Azambacteria bacterium]|tara:strand:+ start:33969 stop:35327 length:1359 start_codon:yes stop_codon:yes gene_type:complete
MQRHFIFSAIMLMVGLQTHSQILPTETLPQILPQITDPVQRAAAQAQQRVLQQHKLTQQLAEKAALPDPLTVLPQTLEVLNQSGEVRWREVEVEHGFRAIEREWLLLVSISEWQQLIARWPQVPALVQSEDHLEALGLRLVNIKVPAELDSATALDHKLKTELTTLAGRNHVYQPQLALSNEQSTSANDRAAMCNIPVTLGMVDTAIALGHPALQQQSGQLTIAQHNFLPADMAQSYGHGTAIAGVLAGQHNNSPLLPQLHLYSAGAFYPSNLYQQSATLSHIVKALNWLASEQVTVINMSLTGPDNPVLAAVVRQLAAQQIILVAAAGNGGPAAAPLFPAAYADVLAVTAVDQQLQLYRWANQGDYIDFAAPGVKVSALRAGGDVAAQSGTSIATPVVSAAIACLRAQQPTITLAQIRQRLIAQARDLGGQGKDPQFGYGLIAAPLKTELK